MILSELLKNLDILEIKGEIPFEDEVKGIAYHSKNVKIGYLFVSIVGYETDGHKYISDALKKGALFCIVEYFVNEDIPQIKVKNPREALAIISSNFYNSPSKEIECIGITATNGKTTTSFMLDSILETTSIKAGLIGTVEIKYGNYSEASSLTTPESLDLQETLRKMSDNGIETVVMEVSSSAQELDRVKMVDFDIVSFNNLSREHIDQHGSFLKYFKEKSKLIKNIKKDGIVILNKDDEKIMSLTNQTEGNIITFSLKENEGDFSIKNLDISTGMGTFLFQINHQIKTKYGVILPQEFPVTLNVAGYSSVMNSIVAIIISLIKNISIEDIQRGLKKFNGVERRFEMIFNESYKILDDHFANTKNIDVTMETLEKMNYNNFLFLYAIRGNRGVQLNKENSIEIVKWIKKLKPKVFYATLSEDVVTKKDKVHQEELEVFKVVMNEANIQVNIIPTLKESISMLLNDVNKEDVVLLAGCQGMDKGAEIVLEEMKRIKTNDPLNSLENIVENRFC